MISKGKWYGSGKWSPLFKNATRKYFLSNSGRVYRIRNEVKIKRRGTFRPKFRVGVFRMKKGWR